MSKDPRFEAIYNKFSQPVYRFISKRIGGNEEAVKEVFTDTLSATWKGFKTFEHKSSYFTWICRIALNKIADYYRGQINERSKFVAPFLEDIANIEDNNLTPDEQFALQELRVSIRKCLDILPTEKRNLLYLRYWRELTVKEISKMFNVSEKVIEGKIYRAKKMLKNVLIKEQEQLSEAYVKNKNI